MDIEESVDSSNIYMLFTQEQTKEKYITGLKKFLEIIGINQEKKLAIDERCKIFAGKAKSENGWLVNVIIQFL